MNAFRKSAPFNNTVACYILNRYDARLEKQDVFLICWLILFALLPQFGQAQSFGPAAVCTSEGVFTYAGAGYDPDTNAITFDRYSGVSTGSITSSYSVSLGGSNANSYDPTTKKFSLVIGSGVFPCDAVALSDDLLNFLGLDVGITVRTSYSITGIWDGATWRSPAYSFVNQNGIHVSKFLNIPNGLIFQIDSSPFYLFKAGSELVIDQASGSWPSSNVFTKASPQAVYIDTSAFLASDIEASGGQGYYSEALTYNDGNAADSLTIHRYCDSSSGVAVFSGDISGQIEGVDFTVTFDPNTWAVTNLVGVYNIGFNNVGVPSYGPPYISWNGELISFSNTDLQGADHYSSASMQVVINRDNSVSLNGPYGAAGTFQPGSFTFDFGGDTNLTNFFGLDGNGDPLGLPPGLTMIFGNDLVSNGAILTSNGQLDDNGQFEEGNASTYYYHRPNGSWGCKLVGLPSDYWFVIAGNSLSQIYVTPNQSSPEMVINAASGWPLSNAYPAQIYVNTELCPIRWETHYENAGVASYHYKTGGVTFRSADNKKSITLNWAWNVGQLSWSWSMDGHSGEWDGGNGFAAIPQGVYISLYPPNAPVYGPGQIFWNGSALTYDGNASILANADVYIGNGIRIQIDSSGRVTVLNNNNLAAGPLYTGTYDPASNLFNLGTGNFGTISDRDGSGNVLSTTTSGGNVDIQGNVLSLGSWVNSAGDSVNGFLLSFTPPPGSGQNALLRFGSTLSLTDWIWSHSVQDGSTDYRTAMQLDSSNRLSLFSSNDDANAKIFLDPENGSGFHGPVRIQPQGDIPMGSFQSGPTPP